MYLYTIQGLNDIVKQSDYYRSIKRPSFQRTFIDKCNSVLHRIITPNLLQYDQAQDFDYVQIPRSVFRRYIGGDYRRIIDLLIKLGYIDTYKNKNNKEIYLSDIDAKALTKQKGIEYSAQSKRYGLGDKAISGKIIKAGVLTDKMVNKLQADKIKSIDKHLSNEIDAKVIHNLSRLYFDFDTAKTIYNELQSNFTQEQRDHWQSTFNELRKFNEYDRIEQYKQSQSFYYIVSEKVGRRFHYFANIPKEYRKCLTHRNGQKLIELDLKNAQPLFIVLNYFRDTRRSIQKDYDQKGISYHVMNGSLYSHIAEHALNSGDLDTCLLFGKNYSAFKALVLGKGLYFHYVPLEARQKMEVYLSELFPRFMQWLREQKRTRGYKSIPIEAQRTESNIFVKRFFKDLVPGAFAVPIHDSILCLEQDAQRFTEQLIMHLKKEFKNQLPDKWIRNLIRIER